MATNLENDPWDVFLYEVQMYRAMIHIREKIGKSEGWDIFINQPIPNNIVRTH